MPTTESTILIVDDDEHLLELVQMHIANEGYNTVTAAHGKQALEILNNPSNDIHIIISDIEMPEMDGYEFCETVKKSPATQDIPFIFLSNLSTAEEKIRGYTIGADDYIPKPLDIPELLVKIKSNLMHKNKEDALNLQLQESTKMAFQAMGYSSALGQVLQFTQNTANVLSFDLLAEAVFNTTQEFGLNCIIQFNDVDSLLQFSSKNEITPLEKNIIELLSKNEKRFYDFGARTNINYSSFSLLIKNMPIENEDRYGMLKDILGNFGEAIHSRAIYIHQHGIDEKRKSIIGSVNDSIHNIDMSFKAIQNSNLSAVEYLMDDIEEAMISLALTEGQEESIRNMIKTCYNKINNIFIESSGLNKDLENIRNTLGNEWSQ